MKFRSHVICMACMLVAVAVCGCGNKGGVSTTAKPNVTAHTNKPEVNPEASGTPSQPTAGSNPSLPLGESGYPAANPFGLGPTPGAAPTPGTPGTAPVKPLPPNARPEARQLFAALRNAYRSARSLKVSGTSSMTVKQDGKLVMRQAGIKLSTTYKAPSKFILDTPDGATTCDGKSVCMYGKAAKRYQKGPFSKDVARMLVYSKPGVGIMGLVFGMDYATGIETYKLLPDAKMSGRDTFVLSLRFKKGAAGSPDSVVTQTLWIGKRDLGIYRNEVVSVTRPRAPKGYTGKVPKLIEARLVDTAASIAFNPKLSDAAFVFRPPSGAKAAKIAQPPKPVNLIGKPAPDFAFTWTDGSKKKLSDFRGKPVVLVFWAMPMPENQVRALKAACDSHKDDAAVIAINFNAGQEKIRDYLKSKKWEFPFVAGTEEIGQVALKQYGMRGVPSVLLIDSAGNVRQATIGVPEAKDMDAKLKEYASAK